MLHFVTPKKLEFVTFQMLLYPQFFCNAGVLISACFNAESISFNVVVLHYIVKNAVVCRLLHTVFLILHITISEYHFPTNCTLYVSSCDTLFKIVKSWQCFHFSQKCTQKLKSFTSYHDM